MVSLQRELTQRCALCVSQGGEKLEEAFFILTELTEKWNSTPLLLNGLASVHLKRLDKPDEPKNAEKLLLQAMEKVQLHASWHLLALHLPSHYTSMLNLLFLVDM